MDIDSELYLKYLHLATKHAKKSTHYKARVGAILGDLRGLKIYSFGINQEKSHPIQKELNIKYRKFKDDSCHHYLHAEIKTLLPWLQRGHTLVDKGIFVARVDKHGNLKIARPCPACMAAIRQAGIDTVCYTTNQGYCMERINL